MSPASSKRASSLPRVPALIGLAGLAAVVGLATPLAAAGKTPPVVQPAGLALASPSLPPTPSLPVPKLTPPAIASPVVSPPAPLPSPSLPPTSPPPVPTPTLPGVTPTPSVPPVGATASPTPPATPGGAPGGSNGGGGGGTGGGPAGGPAGGIHIPLTAIVLRSPFDIALAGALAVLPLLAGIWLLLFGRTWGQARRMRDARIRLAVASDLGISPRELSSLSTASLFKLREEAAFDELTGVLRRAAGIAALEREIARARRQKTILALAFVDLDGLKLANDSQGHRAGDELLQGLVKVLKRGLRAQDLVLRYGGDEFVCVLPDTVYDGARAKLSLLQTEAATAGVRFSAGFAQLEPSDDVVSLLGRADAELYEAKARRVKTPVPAGGLRDAAGRRIPA